MTSQSKVNANSLTLNNTTCVHEFYHKQLTQTAGWPLTNSDEYQYANTAATHQFHQHGNSMEDQFLAVMDTAARQWNTQMDDPYLHDQLSQIQVSNQETVHAAS